ncbi:hypothetical protein LINGRAHAP2_LOCUS27918, partial [Linum grandiflorum]
RIIDGKAGTLYCSSAIVAEAYAIKEATKAAIQFSDHCHILSDCKVLIEAISGPKQQWPWQCYALLGSIEGMCSTAPHTSFHFIPQAENARADLVAKTVRLGNLLPGWITSLL